MSALWWPLYLVGMGLLAAGSGAMWLRGTWGRVGVAVFAGGGIALLTAGIVRSLAYGRPPVWGTFENTGVAAFAIVMVALACFFVGPFAGRTDLTRVIAPSTVALLGYGLLFQRAPLIMEATGRSYVGYIHAFVGWLDFAVLLAATLAAGVLLTRRPEDADLWDEAAMRLVGVGFGLLTLTMASGALYSFLLYSDWYRWQLVESLAAATWLAYGLVLHSRLMFGWRGRKFAVATISVVPLLLAAFWIWSVYPYTYHYFETVLITR